MGEGIWKKSVNLPRGLDRHCCEDVEMGGDRGVIVVFEKRGSPAFWLLLVFLRLVWHISTQ